MLVHTKPSACVWGLSLCSLAMNHACRRDVVQATTTLACLVSKPSGQVGSPSLHLCVSVLHALCNQVNHLMIPCQLGFQHHIISCSLQGFCGDAMAVK